MNQELGREYLIYLQIYDGQTDKELMESICM